MDAEELITAYWRSWQDPSDFAEMESYLADDFVFDAGAGELVGAATVRAMVEQNPEPWVDVRMVDAAYWDDGGVIVYEGTGSRGGIRHRIAELIRVRNGRIGSISATFAQLAAAATEA